MTKRKFKIGTLILGGEEYPACVNVRVMQRLEDAGISLEGVLSEGGRRWSNLAKLVALAIEEGTALAGGDDPAPTEDEISSMIDITDLEDVSGQLAILLGSKNRTVEAEAPKN